MSDAPPDMMPDPRLLRPAVISFLANVDEVLYWPEIHTAATRLENGVLTLYLGDYYALLSPQGKAEMLNHEAGHFVMMHIPRRGDRQPVPWNVVIDASLHFCRVCDWQLVDRELTAKLGRPFESSTFDRIIDKNGNKMAPMPPEMAYDMLPTMEIGVSVCGSTQNSTSDGRQNIHSMIKQMKATNDILAGDPDFANKLTGSTNASGSGEGMRSTPESQPVRPWIRQILQYLVSTTVREDRQRSWRREHRIFPDDLPGQSRFTGKGALFLFDASGSVPDEQVGEFIAIVKTVRELKGSDAVVFDSKWTKPIPFTRPDQIMEALQKMGGGTCIKAVGEAMRDPERPAIWITDAYTGDGWPSPHSHSEVWCVFGGGPNPPNGVTLRIDHTKE